MERPKYYFKLKIKKGTTINTFINYEKLTLITKVLLKNK